MGLKDAVATELEAARRRSLDLLAPISDRELTRQHSPLMSPLAWDLAHIGNYEELWLLRSLGGQALRPDCDDVYDAFRHN
ncbi:MAG: DinB family protein, partial [Acidimicrobiales bacterium]